ncbi:DUF2163 domain-containing protein [Alkalilacustris brevis]|uniref:DUF2163 domain-containing protein n=1 Tax=Alkalilacustris brevis TaxID=2026338 RepID=UPI000E0D8B91|nr:DUF2163 domain-containing protein [Alkalilacustris brevis]
MNDLQEHLAGGATTTARAWAITRRDGTVQGFTDHDRDLVFEGITFRADSGLTARALQQSTGLAVDNSEALGALSSAALTEADLLAGRYDGAGLCIWQVNWADVAQRALVFRGSLGEVARSGGAFRAELRGLTEPLGQPVGRIFQAECTAVLGDAGCRFDTTQSGFSAEAELVTLPRPAVLRLSGLAGFDARWFEKGRVTVLCGEAEGLVGLVKADPEGAGPDGLREITLWQEFAAPLSPGDRLRLEAGCDKRAETCRLKFANFLNFRGFPDIPGEDWLLAVPREDGGNDGGSRKR